MRDRNTSCNNNLVSLCRMMRAWKRTWDVPIGGLLVDTLAYQFIEHYQYRDKSYLYYDFLCRDFFKWLGKIQTRFIGKRQEVGSTYTARGCFNNKAKRCYNNALEAIEHENANSRREWFAKQKWREIFGTAFPD